MYVCDSLYIRNRSRDCFKYWQGSLTLSDQDVDEYKIHVIDKEIKQKTV